MNPKLIGLDGRAFAGILATTFSTIAADYNIFIGAIAGTATAFYMSLRAYREWCKVRSERKNKL